MCEWRARAGGWGRRTGVSPAVQLKEDGARRKKKEKKKRNEIKKKKKEEES